MKVALHSQAVGAPWRFSRLSMAWKQAEECPIVLAKVTPVPQHTGPEQAPLAQRQVVAAPLRAAVIAL